MIDDSSMLDFKLWHVPSQWQRQRLCQRVELLWKVMKSTEYFINVLAILGTNRQTAFDVVTGRFTRSNSAANKPDVTVESSRAPFHPTPAE
jgi:putative heme degradation protein